ncbi:MAG: ComF family protein [Thermodesulfovibrionales bacterium]|nr:ComF family protein [Thermodesulfovibrionales bacterium]
MQGLSYGKLILDSIIKGLFPSICPLCDSESSNKFYPFCIDCWNGVEPFIGNRCNVCSIPLPQGSSICGDCIKNRPYFKNSFVYGLFDGVLRQAIAHLKYSGIRKLAKPLSELLLELSLPESDLIVPVPPDSQRLKTRGFNHTSLIAKEISRRLSLPLEINGLIKIKSTPQQIGLKREERLKNLRRAFRALKNFSGKRILLIDDVITTGTTASECARALLKAGAQEVHLLAIARSAVDYIHNIDFSIPERLT